MGQKPAVHLNRQSLGTLADRIAVPQYDRSALQSSILHLGVGGFHRAHMAAYTDELLNTGQSDWCINGVGLTGADERMARTLGEQNGLYTLLARGKETEEARVVGSITDYFHAPNGAAGLCERVAAEYYRILSLTVTENGYYYTGDDRHLDVDHPAVAQDLKTPDNPRTAVGFVFRVAQLRIGARRPLPTFLSCDNIPHNGSTLRRLVLQFANDIDRDVEAVLAEQGRFPNCMVDRITPATVDGDRKYVLEHWGIEDAWPVVCEDFRQWYVEDNFADGRPEWDSVGAEFVQDVTPFELMKIRLLNGSHSALAYMSYLLGFRRVDQAMNDTDVAAFVRLYMAEIEPAVGSVPGVDLGHYQAKLVERFSNPAVADQVVRLCEDGSRKIPNMMLEPIAVLARTGGSYQHGAFAIAAWIRFLQGTDEEGRSIEIKDPNASMLNDTANRCEHDIQPFLAMSTVFPASLRADKGFSHAVEKWYLRIKRVGTRSAVKKLLGGE